MTKALCQMHKSKVFVVVIVGIVVVVNVVTSVSRLPQWHGIHCKT